MAKPLTADDLIPLVAELPPEERIRLALLVLSAVRDPAADASAYRMKRVPGGEFSQDDDSLAWEGEGWEAPGEAR